MRSRGASPRLGELHAASMPRSPQRGTTNEGGVGSQTGRSQPIPALPSEKQQQKAIKTIRALLLLLEPEVEKNPLNTSVHSSAKFSYFYVLQVRGETRQMAAQSFH